MAATDSAQQAVELMLHCNSWQQAQRIVDHLLHEQLITNAEFIPMQQAGAGIKLVMASAAHAVSQIEAEIVGLYEKELSMLHIIVSDTSSN